MANPFFSFALSFEKPKIKKLLQSVYGVGQTLCSGWNSACDQPCCRGRCDSIHLKSGSLLKSIRSIINIPEGVVKRLFHKSPITINSMQMFVFFFCSLLISYEKAFWPHYNFTKNFLRVLHASWSNSLIFFLPLSVSTVYLGICLMNTYFSSSEIVNNLPIFHYKFRSALRLVFAPVGFHTETWHCCTGTEH